MALTDGQDRGKEGWGESYALTLKQVWTSMSTSVPNMYLLGSEPVVVRFHWMVALKSASARQSCAVMPLATSRAAARTLVGVNCMLKDWCVDQGDLKIFVRRLLMSWSNEAATSKR